MVNIIKEQLIKNQLCDIEHQLEREVFSKKLLNLFRSLNNRKFIFVERSGNFGDYLIWKGAEKLAKIAKIDFETVKFKTFLQNNYPDDAVVYIHGGGGSNVFWIDNGMMNSLTKAISTHRGVVILGPETFCDEKRSLKELIKSFIYHRTAKQVYIFTRDNTSYKFLKESLPDEIDLVLDHDTALNLTEYDLGCTDIASKYVLYAIRKDKEAIDIASRDFFAVWLDPISHCRSFYDWLALHVRAEKIITNRLHSAILGSILDKPTTLLPNSYHKNRSMWEHSLQMRGVQWAENVKVPRWNYPFNAILPLRKVASSYKFQGTVQVFFGVR